MDVIKESLLLRTYLIINLEIGILDIKSIRSLKRNVEIKPCIK